jgi:Ni2+-binding GTPase involved in maturation of urease and hydrogenase
MNKEMINKMKNYKIVGCITVSCYTEVQANSEEEALEIAKQRETSNFCYNPYTSSVKRSWHVESDGEPFDLEIYESEDIEED